MATKLTITADANQAKQELSGLADAIDQAGISAMEASEFAEVLGEAIEGQGAWEKATGGARDFEIELGKLEKELPPLNEQIHTLKTRLGDVGGDTTITKLNAAFNGISAMVQVGEKLFRAFGKARDMIRDMAEAGNADFASLNDSINRVESSFSSFLDRLSASQAGGDAIEAMASKLDDMAGGVEALPDLWDSLRASVLEVSHALDFTVRSGGEADQLHLKRMRQIQEEMTAREDAHQAELRRREAAADSAAADGIEADLAKQRAMEAEQAAAREINNRSSVNAAIEKELEFMRSLAAERKLTDEEREGFQRRIMQLEAHGREVERKGHADRINQLNAERQAEEDHLQWKQEREREVAEAAIAFQRRRLEAFNQFAEDIAARMAESQAAQERIQQESLARQRAAYEAHVKGLQQGFEQGGAVDAIQDAANDPRAMADRLAQNRADATRQELEGSGMSESAIEQRVEQARRQAFRQAQQQLQGGGRGRGGPSFSDDELRRATMDNTKAQFDQIRASGEVSQAAIDALARATVEQRKQSDELNALNEQIAEIKRQVGATQQDGDRRRSQRMGGRQ